MPCSARLHPPAQGITSIPEPAGNAAGLPEARRYLEQECKQYDKEHG